MILSHLRSNAVAYLALVVALGTGTAYAADQVANGSVTAKKLAKNAVTSPKIKKNAVRSVDIKDGSVGAADLQAGLLPAGLAISAASEGSNPAVTPDEPNNRTHAFTSTGGRTYLQFIYNQVGVTCASGLGYIGLYLDGTPVPGTAVIVPETDVPTGVAVAAVVTASAGAHTASIGLDCPDGGLSGSATLYGAWFVLTPKA